MMTTSKQGLDHHFACTVRTEVEERYSNIVSTTELKDNGEGWQYHELGLWTGRKGARVENREHGSRTKR